MPVCLLDYFKVLRPGDVFGAAEGPIAVFPRMPWVDGGTYTISITVQPVDYYSVPFGSEIPIRWSFDVADHFKPPPVLAPSVRGCDVGVAGGWCGRGAVERGRGGVEHDGGERSGSGVCDGVSVRAITAGGVEFELCGRTDHPEPGDREPGVGGKVCIYTYATVDVLAHVSGFFPAGSGFRPVSNPTRVLDTRNGTGAPVAPVGSGATLELQVAGVAGVPSNAVRGGVEHDGGERSGSGGFATVYPCGQSRPEASNLNYAAGQTIPNLVIVVWRRRQRCVSTRTPLLMFSLMCQGSSLPGPGSGRSRTRPGCSDTRNGTGAPVAPVGSGATLELQVAGVAGVPSNVVRCGVEHDGGERSGSGGFATVYPCGQSRPEASNCNYAAGQTIPNLVIVKPRCRRQGVYLHVRHC